MEHDVKSETEGNQTKRVPQQEGNKGLQYFVENGHINIVSVTKKCLVNYKLIFNLPLKLWVSSNQSAQCCSKELP